MSVVVLGRVVPEQFYFGNDEEVELVGLEYIKFSDLPPLFERAYKALPSNGELRFVALDWEYFVQYTGRGGLIHQELCDALFPAGGRRSVLDRRTVAKLLFDAGFVKVWSGATLAHPSPEMEVFALKG